MPILADRGMLGRMRNGWWLLLVCALALLGLADGMYLTWIHVPLEFGKASGDLCHALADRGCEVTGGRFGDIGGIPVATIGMAGMAGLFVVALVGFVRRREVDEPYRAAAYALSLASVAASLSMVVASFVERSFCPFCIAWYVINFALLLASRAALADDAERRLGGVLSRSLGAPTFAATAAFAFTIAAAMFWLGRERAAVFDERTEMLDKVVAEIRADGRTEIDLAGLPTEGPADAEVTIVEVADFECPFCRRVWEGIHAYRDKSGKSMRIVFLHYPIDGTCNEGLETRHPQACLAAYAVECAGLQDKFFAYGDQLFAHQDSLEREDLLGYARELGLDAAAFETCLDDPSTKLVVQRSIARAMMLEVQATPTFFINGFRFTGAPPEALFDPFIDRMLAAEAAGR